MNINWFPGHMAKALRNIEEYLGLVDIVVETIDARIPRSSRNPKLDEILKDRVERILILNKTDLADPQNTDSWISYYKEEGIDAIASNSLERNSAQKILNQAQELTKDKFAKREENNRGFRPLRIMIVGVPNTGKSTLINTLAGRKAANTSNKAGVTRGPQWINTNNKTVELLDMPGVLWPKLETEEQKLGLAATGAINDDLLPTEEVAYELFKQILVQYPEDLMERFKLESLEMHPYEIFLEAARKRGTIQSGGKIDEHRFSKLFITEFRAAKIGRISLERPHTVFNFDEDNQYFNGDDDLIYGSY